MENNTAAQTPAELTPVPPENWSTPQTILAILAHPDDPEFFCGATLARWTAMGHTVHYVLFTKGDKGVRDEIMDPQVLADIRTHEQRCAADVLGVGEVEFLDYCDGCLEPSLAARRDAARAMRKYKADVVVTSDPNQIFGENSINHPDHRYMGQIVVDAFFPGTGNPLYFPELIEEGLPPVHPRELWLTVTPNPNTVIDVTETWERKIQALHCHGTQISDMNKLDERMRSRLAPESNAEKPRYEERFRRFIFR